jgi:hypothetical protein
VPALTRHDYRTTEFAVPDDVSPVPFETVRGMGRGFGWNRNESDADPAAPSPLAAHALALHGL